jgi:hypothetical protein
MRSHNKFSRASEEQRLVELISRQFILLHRQIIKIVTMDLNYDVRNLYLLNYSSFTF